MRTSVTAATGAPVHDSGRLGVSATNLPGRSIGTGRAISDNITSLTLRDAIRLVGLMPFVEEAIASAELDRDQTHSIDDGCPGGHR